MQEIIQQPLKIWGLEIYKLRKTFETLAFFGFLCYAFRIEKIERFFMKAATFKRTKFACYAAYFTGSVIFCLPPLLFVTLEDMYNVSNTLLGTLVLTNFCTQLIIDLIFTFFSKKFNVGIIVKIMPLITSCGLFLYALSPFLFPNNVYLGLLLGTIVFSVSAGLSEVLLSPMIAAIPSDNPQRDMSLLHSIYAFGVFTMVLVCSIFFKIFGRENWMYLTMFLACLPIIAAVLFMISPMPNMDSNSDTSKAESVKKRTFGVALCVACIFFGACAENAMTNWVSSYMETALHIDKAVGDILGLAGFAILLGLGRILYAKFGKKIIPVLLAGMIGAMMCYLIAGLSTSVIPAFIACILTGLFTSMLWPGTLIMMEEKIPSPGVTAYALMAAGGDLGSSFAPQLMGIVIDGVSQNAVSAGMSLEAARQVGMKTGMLVSAIFPMIGVIVIFVIMRYFKNNHQKSMKNQ